ncbi:MAG: leucine--tRNA ligase [Candidatus Methanomethylophilaceae archaeon]|nr:leucine--tRNA ligase [Candidatus Methanomethylophilaceae archaeon]
MAYDYGTMEKKWQTRWIEAGLDKSERDDSKPKFMAIFAYPGVTGYLHVGHLRGYTYLDAIARYKRMTGYNVLFPVGTHATGNGGISLYRRISRGDEGTIDYLKRNGCTDEDIAKMKDPLSVIEFFNNVYQNDYWRRFGFLSDWRRFTCTLYPDYAKFIEWQFMKLHDAGMLIQKPYYAPVCPNCGPVAVDASETDISKGGKAETQEYTLLKFKHGDEFLIAATLRPETVYGQVCFWVDPETEYNKVRYNGETWIVSPQAAEKLQLQKDGVEVVGKVPGKEMVGWMCEAPMIHREIPVFPATFVNPDVGTGLVTSVPSDAPDDWISLEAIKKNPEMITKYGLTQDILDKAVPISIIEMKGYGDFPAKDIIDKLGIKEPGDPKLLDAKHIVYKDGFHTGKMKDICGEFAGLRVQEAQEKMKQAMIAAGEADVFHDLTEEVVCRCGARVHIKRIDDQWFINYADPKYTQMTKDHCKDMELNPPEWSDNVYGVLDWFRERACVRLGNWLGTKFPYDKKWIIEAISDSTLYPVYYIISIYANEGQIKPEQMTEAFFDYTILGKGDIGQVSDSTGVPRDLLDKIRKDVLYWYPLDLNLGGKEHMTVHFPAFLMNHVAILPPEMWPKGITVNWYITGKKDKTGEATKISKSKGGAQPIPGAAAKFGVDAMRLYYANVASMFVDVEWDEDTVNTYRQRTDRIMIAVQDLIASESDSPKTDIDSWLISRFNNHLANIRKAMDKNDLRAMTTIVYFDMFNDMKWYNRRGGNNKETILDALRIWIQCMMPVTPHVAEELWEQAGFEGLVSAGQLPEPDQSKISISAEYGENLLREAMSDITEIRKIAGIDVKKIVLYTSSQWKRDVMQMALDMMKDGKLTIPDLTKACMAREDLRKNGKAVSSLAQKVAVEFSRSTIEQKLPLVTTDEAALFGSAAKFLSEENGVPVEVYSADTEGIYDPQGKAKVAVPGRPAIYLE